MKKRSFGIVLALIGLCIIGAALYMKCSAELKQKQMIEAFQKSIKEPWTGEDSILTEERTSQEPSSAPAYKTEATPQEITTTAIMEIPRINLKVAVSEGTDSKTLKYAVGHFLGTAMPGEKGNFAVAGHRSYTYGQYFNRADELQIGDNIIVRTKTGEFTYTVFEKKVVEPTDGSVLNPTKDATITLITCTPIRIATHRLVIKGRLT